jgi:hypothetical protein
MSNTSLDNNNQSYTLPDNSDIESPILSKVEISNIIIIPSFNLSTILQRSQTISKSLKKFASSLQIDINTEVSIDGFSVQVVEINTETPSNIYINNYKPLCIIKCNKVTTYFIDQYIFSVLTNPYDFEREYQIPSIFIEPGKKGFAVEDLTNSIIAERLEADVINKFTFCVNELYNDTEMNYIQKRLRKRKVRSLVICITAGFIILAMVLFAIVFNELLFDDDQGTGFWIKLIFFFIFLVILVYLLVRNLIYMAFVYPQLEKYEILSHRATVVDTLQECLETWNRYVFIPKNLFVTIPLNFQYLHVILDLTKEIRIQNHSIGNDSN